MNRTRYKLQRLLEYYYISRGVGHTRAMIEGAKDTDGVIILAHEHRYAVSLARGCKNATPLAWFGYGADTLCGQRKPLLIDNGAMIDILADAINYINTLEHVVARLQAEKSVVAVERKDGPF